MRSIAGVVVLLLASFGLVLTNPAVAQKSFENTHLPEKIEQIERLSDQSADSPSPALQDHQAPEEHLTPRNSGSNSWSAFRYDDLFVDSRDRLFARTAGYHNTLDVYDGSTWQYLDPGDNLPAVPTNIAEDEAGNIWISTEYGLYKYTGNLAPADTIHPPPQEQLSDYISDFVIDDEGRIWMAHEPITNIYGDLLRSGGVSVYDTTQNALIARPDTLEEELSQSAAVGTHRDLLLSESGSVWAIIGGTDSTNAMIAGFNSSIDSAWHFHKSNSDLPTNNFHDMTEDDNGNVWTCFSISPSDTTIGAARYDGSQWTSFTEDNSPLKRSCYTIATGSNGQDIIHGNFDTTMVYDGNGWQKFTGGIEDRPLVGVTDIAHGFDGQSVYSRGLLGAGGLLFRDGSQWDFMSSYTDGGLFSRIIFGVTVDDEGNPWLSGFNGSAYYDGTDFSYYNERDGMADTYSWKVHAASDGTVWFGSASTGVTYLEDGEFTVVDEYGVFEETIFESSDGDIWLGSYNGDGILRYDGEQFTHYDTSNAAIGEQVWSFAEDANGDIIAGGRLGMSMARFDTSTGEWSAWSPEAPTEVRAFEINSDQEGNVWIPSSDSLHKWDGDTIQAIAYPEDNYLGAVHVEPDPEGNVWIGTSSGAVVYNGNTWHRLNLESTVYDIAHGENGDTWLTTFSRGAFKYNRSDALPVEESPDLPEQYTLEANYPNPFNPATVIPFSLPQATDVTIEVYNVAGQHVATLADRQFQAGSHNVKFDAGNLSSGIYMIRAELGTEVQTQKMTLIK